MRRKTGGLILCAILLMVFTFSTGCARKSGTVSPKFGEEDTSAAADTGARRDAGEEAGLGRGPGGEFGEGDLPIPQDERAREYVFEEASRELQPIYFDYDSSALKSQAKAKLERAADWLKMNPRVNVQIEGHCDERGTNEYNLSLGERRALAARRYLVSLGISQDRIFTISYGEERPAKEGHDESAWKANRRDEFKISF